MRGFVCLFLLVILLTDSTSLKKIDRVLKATAQKNDTARTERNQLVHGNKDYLLSNISSIPSTLVIPKSCLKKKTKHLKKERKKLRKLLKDKPILKNKTELNNAMAELNKIDAHIKRCKMKNKRSKNKAKMKTNNTAEITTANATGRNKIITNFNGSLEQKNDEHFKAQSDDYRIVQELGTIQNEILKSTSPTKTNNDSNKNYLVAEEGKYRADKIGGDVVNNKINYADLMAIKTTTLPPMENISLNKILDEFNAIRNEIQELIPNKADYYRSKFAMQGKERSHNRCNIKKGGCHHKCHPFGVMQCSCMAGFKLINRKKCLDINECISNNGGCAKYCHNTPGSYYCSCKKGFRLSDNQKTCIDINECLLRNGHGPCQDTCTNTPGSYQCSCSGLNGTRLSEDEHSCEDIDECLDDKAGCSHLCVNTLGRVYCVCPEGMVLGLDWKTCADVNECEDEEVNKHCKYGCVNTIGSFRCGNSYELQNDQVVPDLVACPKLFPPRLGFLECSREKSLRTNLWSKSGRRRVTNRPGTFCQLRCPDGHEIEGIFKITCGYEGEWFGERSGFCRKKK